MIVSFGASEGTVWACWFYCGFIFSESREYQLTFKKNNDLPKFFQTDKLCSIDDGNKETVEA